MLKFIQKNSVPPGGIYFFRVGETGAYFDALDMPTLLLKVRKYLVANGEETPADLEAQIEDFMCRNLPIGFCTGTTDKPRKKFISIRQIRDATRLIWQRVTMPADEFYVSQAEADRRARICSDCPMNLKGACVSCNEGNLRSFGEMLTGRRATPYDSVLDSCGICGCLLIAKVHVSLDALEATQKHEYPPNCWLHGTKCHIEE